MQCQFNTVQNGDSLKHTDKFVSLMALMMKARRTRWAGHVARMGEKRNAHRLLVGKPEGRRATRKTKT
jgi:hypothetical protein